MGFTLNQDSRKYDNNSNSFKPNSGFTKILCTPEKPLFFLFNEVLPSQRLLYLGNSNLERMSLFTSTAYIINYFENANAKSLKSSHVYTVRAGKLELGLNIPG